MSAQAWKHAPAARVCKFIIGACCFALMIGCASSASNSVSGGQLSATPSSSIASAVGIVTAGLVCATDPAAATICNGLESAVNLYPSCKDNSGNTASADLNNDSCDCGACGNSCAAGEACDGQSGGNCVQAAKCPNGTGGYCTAYVLRDSANCGACGIACSANQICSKGLCVSMPTTLCPGTNTPVNLQSDVSNCGSCGNSCLANGQLCRNGTCQ